MEIIKSPLNYSGSKNYIVDQTTIQAEQFDENVIRSLDQASRELEKNETTRYLQSVLKQL